MTPDLSTGFVKGGECPPGTIERCGKNGQEAAAARGGEEAA